MLALRLHPDRELRLHEEPAPQPVPGETMIRVTAVGLCGSDRHWVVDGGIGDAVLDAPLILGHEFGGIAESGPHRGRRVAVDPAVPCGRCATCAGGLAHLCPDVRFAGHGRTDGALREWIAWPDTCVYPLSDAIEEPHAAMIEPLAVAVHALDLGRVGRGTRVAVIGCGPIGLLIVSLARAAGAAAIVATDRLRHRLDAALDLGASRVIVAPAADEADTTSAAESDGGQEVVFEAAGEAAAVETAIAMAGAGARVVLVGIPADDRMTYSASEARRKGLTLKHSRRSTPASFSRAVRLVEERATDVGSLVSERVPLGDAHLAFRSLVARDGIKLIVEPAAAPRHAVPGAA